MHSLLLGSLNLVTGGKTTIPGRTFGGLGRHSSKPVFRVSQGAERLALPQQACPLCLIGRR